MHGTGRASVIFVSSGGSTRRIPMAITSLSRATDSGHELPTAGIVASSECDSEIAWLAARHLGGAKYRVPDRRSAQPPPDPEEIRSAALRGDRHTSSAPSPSTTRV